MASVYLRWKLLSSPRTVGNQIIEDTCHAEVHPSAPGNEPSCNANPTMPPSLLDNCPTAFPRLAAFHSSEQSFSLYRGFSYLHSQLLLDLEKEISDLERELEEVDQDIDRYDSTSFRSCREGNLEPHGKDNARGRREIMADLRKELVEYDECHLKVRTMQRQRYINVCRWFSTDHSLVQENRLHDPLLLAEAKVGSEESIFSGTRDVPQSSWKGILDSSRPPHARTIHSQILTNKGVLVAAVSLWGLPLATALLTRGVIINGARIMSGVLLTGTGVALVPLQSDGRTGRTLLITLEALWVGIVSCYILLQCLYTSWGWERYLFIALLLTAHFVVALAQTSPTALEGIIRFGPFVLPACAYIVSLLFSERAHARARDVEGNRSLAWEDDIILQAVNGAVSGTS